ncbi:hypothetical protein [Enterococcus sp.]|uniref:hypothetical protein n=1 Tax=Enterococcus sp. TaxID=35783 RepID=UPI0028A12206|nr:hypothetical protein [Enterococcus sp.]
MRQTESLLLLGVFAVGLFVVYWLKKHRHTRHNQALAAQLKRYPSVRQRGWQPGQTGKQSFWFLV